MNLKNQNIDFFELNVNDQLLVEAEVLYDQDKIEVFSELEKGLWVANFKGKYTDEVEIALNNKTISNYSCGCDNFDQKGICEHIVAFLFGIRKEINEKKTLKKERSVRTKSSLSVNQVLNQVSPTSLNSFLKSYAAKDKRFNLLLKAHFAREILGQSSIDEYKSIAESLLSPVKSKDEKIPVSATKVLHLVGVEFLEQFDDAHSLSQYDESFYLLFAIFPKIAYAKAFIKTENKNLDQLWQHAHDRLERLLNSDIAPELRRDIVQESLGLTTKSYYRIYDYSLNIPEILFQNELEAIYLDDLNAAIAKKLKLSERDSDQYNYLSAFQLRSIPLDELKDHGLVKLFESKELVRFADLLMRLESFETCIVILKSALNKNQSKFHLNAIRGKLMHLYKKMGRSEEYSDLAIEVLLNKYNPALFAEIALDPSKTEKLLKFIQNIEKTEVRLDYTAKYYSLNNDQENLMDFLEKNADLALFQQYDAKLYKKYPKRITQKYFQIIEQKLDNLLGSRANADIVALLNHFDYYEMFLLKRQVKSFLKENYSHRTQFIENIKG